jgi:hypothetical protein
MTPVLFISSTALPTRRRTLHIARPPRTSRRTHCRRPAEMLWNPLARPASLPTNRDREARQHDLADARLVYDYAPSTAVKHIVVNKSPLPRAELPGVAWRFLAARVVLRIKNSFKGGTSAFAAPIRPRSAIADPLRSGLRALESGLATISIYILSSLLIAIPSERLSASLRTRISAFLFEAIDKRVAVVKAVLEARAADEATCRSHDEHTSTHSPEFAATKDFQALVDVEHMGYAERSYYQDFSSDKVFARARVAGLNPMSLRAVTAADMDSARTGWMPTDDHLKRASPAFFSDSLAQAREDSRLYMLDHKWLEEAPDSKTDSRFVFIPTTLFAVPADENDRWESPLVPVAIWIYRKGMGVADARLYTSGDGWAWQIAKLIVNALDANDHEYYRHLGLTHLLVEPFAIALKRQLHVTHPVAQLLEPHIVGTMFINHEAVQTLLAQNGPVDMNLMSPISQMAPVLNKQLAGLRFNDNFLEVSLESRGVTGSKLEYPYRDDARVLWEAIHTWIESYVSEYYVDDDAVVGDSELQNWAQEIVSDAVNVDAFGDEAFLNGGGKYVISTSAYLTKALTMIVFTASCQHSALNFAQKTFLAYGPAWPLALKRGELPPAGINALKCTEADWRAWLPSHKEAMVQWSVNQLLGGVCFTRLGQYPSGLTAGKPGLQKGLAAFQQTLLEIGSAIEKREEGASLKYLFLHPSNIAASINI